MTIEEGRVAWIVPLRVVTAGAGTWSKWEASTNDQGKDCIRKMAKHTEQVGWMMYDQENRCTISFEDPVNPPPGVLDKDIFGLPGLDVPYKESYRNGWKEVF